jgi:hypothetical protein
VERGLGMIHSLGEKIGDRRATKFKQISEVARRPFCGNEKKWRKMKKKKKICRQGIYKG